MKNTNGHCHSVTPSPTSEAKPFTFEHERISRHQQANSDFLKTTDIDRVQLEFESWLITNIVSLFFPFEQDSVGNTGVLCLLILKTTGSVLKLSMSLNPWMQLFFTLDKPIESEFAAITNFHPPSEFAAITNLPLGGGRISDSFYKASLKLHETNLQLIVLVADYVTGDNNYTMSVRCIQHTKHTSSNPEGFGQVIMIMRKQQVILHESVLTEANHS